MSEHTPGPWDFQPEQWGEDGSYGPPEVIDSAQRGVAIIRVGLEGTEANARLISAAPELLDALKQSRCEFCGFTYGAPRGDCETCADRVAVIAKAEGRS